MPSRKKAQGKYTSPICTISSSHSTSMLIRSIFLLLIGQQRKSRPKKVSYQHRQQPRRCGHGPLCVTTEAISFMSEFKTQFLQLVDDSSDFCGQVAIENCMEKYPDIWSDKLNREDITKMLMFEAISNILDEDACGLFVAQEFATSILILEEAPVRKIRDLRQGGKPTLLVFFGKRATCNCMKEKYEVVKKMPKQGKCDGCKQTIERRELKLCACQVEQYCSIKCQRESWAGHKRDCEAMRNGEVKIIYYHKGKILYSL